MTRSINPALCRLYLKKSVDLLDRLVAFIGQCDGNEDKAEEQHVHYRIGYKSMKDQEHSIKLKLSPQGIQKSKNDVQSVKECQRSRQFVETGVHPWRGTVI